MFCEQNNFEKNIIRAKQNLLDELTAQLEKLPEGQARTKIYNARKEFFNGKKVNWQKLEAQTGIALKAVEEFQNAVQKLEDQTQIVERQWFASLHEKQEVLQKISGEENFQRGLLFASHDLLDRLPDFQKYLPRNFSKKDRQTALAIYQFAARASAKTSPFSRFTSVQLLELDNNGSTDWADFSPHDESVKISSKSAQSAFPLLSSTISKSATTPNVTILEAIYHLLLPCPAFYQNLKIKLNPCVAGVSKTYECLFFDGQNESFQKLESSPLLDFIVAQLLDNQRHIQFSKLKDTLAEAVEASPEALENHLFELTEIGLLEWDWPEKGFSPNWCGGLLNFLGFLPAEPLIVETAMLLQWLRTAARTLPFQNIGEAQKTMQTAANQLKTHFEKFDGIAPPLKPEQVFYEDWSTSPKGICPRHLLDFLEQNAGDLAKTIWPNFSETPKEKRGQSPLSFEEGLGAGFKKWQAQKISWKQNHRTQSTENQQDMGILAQFFKDENGQLNMVLNNVFPGGGRMFSRWLHLFPGEEVEKVKAWNASFPPEKPRLEKVSFAGFGWHNANFGPTLTEREIDWPGGRTRSKPEKTVLAADLKLPDLGFTVFDAGLESWASRTPAARMLLDLGVPKIELKTGRQNFVKNENTGTRGEKKTAPVGVPDFDKTLNDNELEGIFVLPRIQQNQIVSRRKTWVLEEKHWSRFSKSGQNGWQFFVEIWKFHQKFDLPRFAFFRFPEKSEKPQFLDFDCPMSVLLFEKTLRQGRGRLEVQEMLPVPDDRAMEFAFELRPSI